MKFYIFGDNSGKAEIKVSAKNATQIRTLEEALEMMKIYINEVRYTDIYLLVDFERYNNKFLFGNKATLKDDLENDLPFLIVAEWHLGDDKEEIVRCDHTEINMYGFKHEFTNNYRAVLAYTSYISLGKNCTFNIVYSKTEYVKGEKVTRKFIRKISDSHSLREQKTTPITKFIISSMDHWEFVPIHKVKIIGDVNLKSNVKKLAVY